MDEPADLEELLQLVVSDDPTEVDHAHARALALTRRSTRAKRVAAMAYDRTRAFSGRSQKFGTQAVMVAGERQLWPVDPVTTDSERAKWTVEPLQQLRADLQGAPLIGKAPMRCLLRQRRASLDAAQVAQWSAAIAQHADELLAARAEQACIAAYVALPGEADPRPLVERLQPAVAQLTLPQVDGEQMAFRAWQLQDELRSASFGLSEPSPGAPEHVPDIVLTPLLGFDERGMRLGQGKGYYDRKLAMLPDAFTVGIAFDCQLLPRVPSDAHDRRLDAIVTESGVRSFSS